MSDQQQLTLQIEIAPTDEFNPDPATLEEVSNSVFTSMHNEGHNIRPSYTGERGGALYDVVLQVGVFTGSGTGSSRTRFQSVR